MRTVISIQRCCTRKFANLASVFNSKEPYTKIRPIHKQGLLLYPELKTSKGFYLLHENVKLTTAHLVDEALSKSRNRKMVQIFDDMSDCICRVADMADFIRIADPRDDYRNAAQDVHTAISALVEELNTNAALYDAIKGVVDNGDTFPTDDIDQRTARLFMEDFEQCGIDLPIERRKQFVTTNSRILQKGSDFLYYGQQPASILVKNLPDEVRSAFGVPTDGRLSLNGNCGEQSSETMREAGYKIFYLEDKRLLELVSSLLQERYQLARLVGYDSFSQRALKTTMVENPETVLQFLTMLSEKTSSLVDDEMKQLSEIKLQTENKRSDQVNVWDMPYLFALEKQRTLVNQTLTAERPVLRKPTMCVGLLQHLHLKGYMVKILRFSVSDTDLSAYFSLGTCLQGLSRLFMSLYGVELRPVPALRGELWSDDVRKLVLIDTCSSPPRNIGYIYCDFFERANKPIQAYTYMALVALSEIHVYLKPDCHFTIQGGRRLVDGSYQMPTVVLMMNFPRVLDLDGFCLLTPDMVSNLFHEFGHAMHSMLGRTRYQHVTGTRCTTDFAEVPSVLMEYFANDRRVLKDIGYHYQSGSPLPDELANEVQQRSRTFMALDLMRQVFHSVLDQRFHGDLSKVDFSHHQWTVELLKQATSQFSVFPHTENTAWFQRFSHLVGYGAKYYSYLWSRSVASKIWQQSFVNDPYNRKQGTQFAREILSYGGSLPAKILLKNFLGETLTVESLVDSLVDDLASCR